MLEVKIGDEVVDAGDFTALLAAASRAVEARNSEQTLHDLGRPELYEILKSMTALVFATHIAIGGILMVRARSGLRDSALEFLREELGEAVQTKEIGLDDGPALVMPA